MATNKIKRAIKIAERDEAQRNDLFATTNLLAQHHANIATNEIMGDGAIDEILLYRLTPPEPLRKRAAEYYRTNIERVTLYLSRCVCTKTMDAIVTDYSRVIAGNFNITATAEQIDEFLHYTTPIEAFNADRVVLYGILYTLYAYYRKGINDYNKLVETADTQTIEQYTEGIKSNCMEARSFIWLISTTGIDMAKLLKVYESQLTALINTCTAMGNLTEYAYYYTFAKSCLYATPEELKEIPEPPAQWKDNASIQAFSEDVLQQVNNSIKDIETAIEALSEFQRHDTVVKAVDTLHVFNPNTQQPFQNVCSLVEWDINRRIDNMANVLSTSQTICNILSRDVWATPESTGGIFSPIKSLILDYIKQNQTDTTPTDGLFERVIEAINLLHSKSRINPFNGYYTYTTSFSELATLCGYSDAGGDTIKQISIILTLLQNLYVRVCKPKGDIAVQILNMPSFGLSGEFANRVELRVPAGIFSGKQQFISVAKYEIIKKEIKGQAENHFLYQLLNKEHIKEDDLLNEVFGYDTKMAMIEPENITEQKTVRESIRKHKPRDRQNIARWFEKYVKNGTIVSYRYNADTNVYSWNKSTREQEPAQ